MLIYKILLPSEWDEFQTLGRFDGSPLDRSSGFIHCSSRTQVAGTAARVFGGQPELVVVALDTSLLGSSLRWEDAVNGGPYPHIYAALSAEAVTAIYRIAGAASVDDELPTE